jgi:hypothetical protein
MANQVNPLDDEENKQVTTAQSGVVGGGTSDAGGATAGSGWTNLNQYLDANKGAGEQIANAAVKDTGNQFAADKGAIDSWSKGLQDQIGATKQADTDQANMYSGQAASAGSNFGQAAQQQSFDAWKNATQNAPKQFEEQAGYQDAYGAQSKIKDNLGLIKDPTKQSKIVADTFRKDRPTYSQGMANLDTFLATADGGNSLNQKLSGLAGQYSGDFLGDSKNAYGAGVTDLQSTMGKNRGDVMGAISNQYNTLKSQADSGVQGLNASQISAPSIEAMNRGATVTSKSNASYADALDPTKLADLEALATLSGQQFDANQKNKTFNKGSYNDYSRAPQEFTQPEVQPEADYIKGSPGRDLGTSAKRAGTAASDVLKGGAKILQRPSGGRFKF